MNSYSVVEPVLAVVAIHQPNFFPWLGYFDKIQRSDVFVFLDHVQLPKTGGTWSNRVKLLVSGEAKWATVPIDRSFHGVRAINEMYFQSTVSWRRDFLCLLERSYRNAPYYGEVIPILRPLVSNPENNIALYNANAVIELAGMFGVPRGKFRFSSEMNSVGQSNHMLISLVRAAKGDVYMYGGGADGYQDDSLFVAAQIRLASQGFTSPAYPQFGLDSPVHGLSIIDALMQLGFEGTTRLIGGNADSGCIE